MDTVLDNLTATRDINVYMDMVKQIKEKYLIIVSVKDTFGAHIPEDALQKIKDIGFQNISTQLHIMYAGIIDSGNILFDKCSERPDDSIIYDEKINSDLSLYVTSKSWTGGNEAVIKINETDYSLNDRGLNIVIFDREKNEVIDSVTYDSYSKAPLFYHKNLQFDDRFFENNFYIPKKYMSIWKDAYSKRYFSNRALSVQEVQNAIILPNKIINNAAHGGVCDENFHLIAGHQTLDQNNNAWTRNIAGSYYVPKEEITYIDETVVYGGTMIDHPGHMIIECFADRIWYLIENSDSKVKIAIPYIWGTGSACFIKEFMELTEIDDSRIIWVDKPMKFKKVIIPDQSSIPYFGYFPYEYTQKFVLVWEKIAERITPKKIKKVYFTKRKTARGNIIGEDFFINFYRSKGFEIFDPEDYSILEKAEILRDAEEFVAMTGTSCHYVVFCKPTVKFTILARTNDFPLSIQALINEALKIKNFKVVDVSQNFFHKDMTWAANLVGVTENFIKYTEEVYKEKPNFTVADSLKRNLYKYMKMIPKYYTDPQLFDKIKNQKMLTVLQNISEVFLGKDFDTSKLDLSTNESNLSEKVKVLQQDINTNIKRISELTNEVSDLKQKNEALKLQLTALENTNKTLMSANSHLAQSVTEISSLFKNNTDQGE